MQSQKLLCCLAVVLTGVCAFAQGTFQNLNFEQASDTPISPGSPLVWTTNALPRACPKGAGFGASMIIVDPRVLHYQ